MDSFRDGIERLMDTISGGLSNLFGSENYLPSMRINLMGESPSKTRSDVERGIESEPNDLVALVQGTTIIEDETVEKIKAVYTWEPYRIELNRNAYFHVYTRAGNPNHNLSLGFVAVLYEREQDEYKPTNILSAPWIDRGAIKTGCRQTFDAIYVGAGMDKRKLNEELGSGSAKYGIEAIREINRVHKLLKED